MSKYWFVAAYILLESVVVAVFISNAWWKGAAVGAIVGFPLGLWLAEARRSERRLFFAELYQDEMRRLEREVASLR